MSRTVVAVLAVLQATLWSGNALATRRYYSDLVAQSPNERYRLEARSPDNRKKEYPTPFQHDFAYTCIDMGNRQVLWRRQQAEGSPVEVFIDDDCWVVIRTSGDRLVIVDPEGGDRGTVNLLEEMSEDGVARYVHRTTAGPWWDPSSIWYFADSGEARLFAVRPWWGDRIVADLEQGVPVDQRGATSRHLDQTERSFIVDELKAGLQHRNIWDKTTDSGYLEEGGVALHRVWTAAYLAGRTGADDAVALLRQLDDAAPCGRWMHLPGDAPPAGSGLPMLHYRNFTVRQAAKLSLLRLGEIPQQVAGTRFYVGTGDGKAKPYEPAAPARPRTEAARSIQDGMTPIEVLAALGVPDCCNWEVWFYELDADPPFTLVVHWGENWAAEVERQTPPIWKGTQLDENVLWDQGTELKFRNNSGTCWARQWAEAEPGWVSVDDLLLQMPCRDTLTPLQYAAAVGDGATAKRLLREGAEPNKADAGGWTPMHWAAARGHEEVVRLLLDHGGRPDIRDSVAGSPLNWAALTSHDDIADTLIAARKKVEATHQPRSESPDSRRDEQDKTTRSPWLRSVRIRGLWGCEPEITAAPGEWVQIRQNLWWCLTEGSDMTFSEDGPLVSLSIDGGPASVMGCRVRGHEDIQVLRSILPERNDGLTVWVENPLVEEVVGLPGAGRITSVVVDAPVTPDEIGRLSVLPGLESAAVSCHYLTDLTSLAGLTGLRSLRLTEGARIRDVSPLSSLGALACLEMEGFKALEDLAPIGTLTRLRSLSIGRIAEDADMAPLASLSGLKALGLVGCSAESNLPALAGLKRLQRFEVNSYGGANVSPLAQLPNLTGLGLYRCEDRIDLSPLKALPGLRDLSLTMQADRLDIQDTLSWFPGLVGLSLSIINGSTDLSAVRGRSDLKTLEVDDLGRLRDLSDLSVLEGLRNLSLRGSGKVQDISALSGLAKLRILALSWLTELPLDFSAMSTLAELERLEVSLSDLSDLRPLAGMVQLRVVDLGFSELDEEAAGVGHPNLDTVMLPSRNGLATGVLALGALPDLIDLSLPEGCSDMELRALSPELAHLQRLDLESCVDTIGHPFSPSWQGISSFAPLTRLVELRELRACKTDPERPIDLTPLTNLRKLEILNLWRCGVAVDLAPLASMTHLRDVSLPWAKEYTIKDLRPLQAAIAQGARVWTAPGPSNPVERMLTAGEPDRGPPDVHRAARTADLPALRQLLQDDARAARPRDDFCRTPLHYAAGEGHGEAVQLLTESGAELDARDPNGLSPLHWTVLNARPDAARKLLQLGAGADVVDREGFTPLHWAAHLGHEPIARLLAESGADLSAEDSEGWTPLHRALEAGSRSIAEMLIARGADVNSADGLALNMAAAGGDDRVTRILLDAGARPKGLRKAAMALIDALEKGHESTAVLLVEHGADPNVETTLDETPLHVAAEEGMVKAVEALLAHGAAVNARDYWEKTPLHRAARSDAKHNAVEISRLLLKDGADVHARDERGETPLFIAAERGMPELLALLIEAGGDVHTRNKWGDGPLSRTYSNEVKKILREHGVTQ